MSKKRKKRKLARDQMDALEKWHQDMLEYWDEEYTNHIPTTNKGQTVNVNTSSSSGTTSGKEIVQQKGIAGFLEATFTHKIATTELTAKFGFKMDHDMWRQICAFFEWTQAEWHSEAQVRLYVNPAQKKWGVWAFPQEMNTGMSAREIETHANWADGVRRFSTSDGWWYFGTVHHHCSSGAFQSSVDAENEKKIDGLHITVGYIGRTKYDLHWRLSLGGQFYQPKLSNFWDPGDYLAGIPEMFREKMPQPEEASLLQMCQPPSKEQKFPDEWKANIIAKPKEVRVIAGFSNTDEEDHRVKHWSAKTDYIVRGKSNFEWELKRARKAVLEYLDKNFDYNKNPKGPKNSKQHALMWLHEMLDSLNEHDFNIIDILGQCDILPENLIAFLKLPDKKDAPKPVLDTKTSPTGDSKTNGTVNTPAVGGVKRVGLVDHCGYCKCALPNHETWCAVLQNAYGVSS